jgi:hypothetical protein
MNLKGLRKGWAALWTNDSYAGAACSFCGQPRAGVAFLVEGPSAYICDRCAILSVAICAQHENTDPRDVTFRALAETVAGIAVETPYACLEPLLGAMIGLATSTASRSTAYLAAVRHGHYELALRALSGITPQERTDAVWLNIAALNVNLERYDDARAALASVPETASEADRLFASCHEASIAGKHGPQMSDDELETLLLRAQAHGTPPLVTETLEAIARHRAAKADVPGALSAVDEAITLHESAAILLLRGDLLAASDAVAATDAWRRSLARSHPDGVDAQRARDRLERHGSHPYRRPA